jgi:nitrate reductase beta subunit
MHRLLAVAKYADRYVVPAAHKEDAAALSAMENRCPVESSGAPEDTGGGRVMLGIPTLRRKNTGDRP